MDKYDLSDTEEVLVSKNYARWTSLPGVDISDRAIMRGSIRATGEGLKALSQDVWWRRWRRALVAFLGFALSAAVGSAITYCVADWMDR